MDLYIRTYLRRLRLLARTEIERQSWAFLRIYIFWFLYIIGLVSIPIVITPSRTGLTRAAGLRMLLVLWTIGLVFVTARFLDQRLVHSFGLKVDQQWITDGFAGIIIGAAILTGATIIGLTGGWLVICLNYVYILCDPSKSTRENVTYRLEVQGLEVRRVEGLAF